MTGGGSKSFSDIPYSANSRSSTSDSHNLSNSNDPSSVQIQLYYFSPGLKDQEIIALVLKYSNVPVVSIVGLITIKSDVGVGKTATFAVLKSEVERVLSFFDGRRLSSGKLKAEVVNHQEDKRLNPSDRKRSRQISPRSLSPLLSLPHPRPLPTSTSNSTTSLLQESITIYDEPPRTHPPRSFPLFISNLPNIPDVELKRSVRNILSEYFVQLGKPDVRTASHCGAKYLFILVLYKGPESFEEMQEKLEGTVGGNKLQFRAQLRNPELLGRDWDDQEDMLLQQEEIECAKIKKVKNEKRAREKEEQRRKRKIRDSERREEKSSRSRDEKVVDTCELFMLTSLHT